MHSVRYHGLAKRTDTNGPSNAYYLKIYNIALGYSYEALVLSPSTIGTCYIGYIQSSRR